MRGRGKERGERSRRGRLGRLEEGGVRRGVTSLGGCNAWWTRLPKHGASQFIQTARMGRLLA